MFPKIYAAGNYVNTYNRAIAVYTDNTTFPNQPYDIAIGGITYDNGIHGL